MMSAVVDNTSTAGTCHAGTIARSGLSRGNGGRVIAFDARGDIALARFECEVRGVAAALPPATHAVNLCDDRYRFLVAFCAAALRGQTTLLPPSRAPAVIADVMAQHPGSVCIGDGPLAAPPPGYWRLPDVLPQRAGTAPAIDPAALVAIGFTSGSTGRPQANRKTWAGFLASTAQNRAALADLLDRDGGTRLVATVPPQHMYGMEMSVLLPLLGEVAVHSARPFFPHDVARVLAESGRRPLLVTTPVHLRALVQAAEADPQLKVPPLAAIVSATAPLPAAIARAAEARFGCEVRELFGSTETCVVARRRPARETAWTRLPGVRLVPQPDGTAVHAPHLPAAVVLADLVELRADGRFELCGRQADLLEIAGKRASLGDLTCKLLAVPGVEDGVVLQLDPGATGGVRRIAALAVAPTLDAAAILAALRGHCDPVFLPRRLRCVAALPRTDCGKLPRQALLDLLRG